MSRNVEVVLNFKEMGFDEIMSKIKSQVDSLQGAFEKVGNAVSALDSVNEAFGKMSKTIEPVTKTTTTVTETFAEFTGVQQEILSVGEDFAVLAETQTRALGSLTAATTTQTTVDTTSAAVKGKATLAQKALNAAMRANAILAIIGLVIELIDFIKFLANTINDLTGWWNSSKEAMTENGQTMSDLADTYNRSTDEIEADMQRMGGATLDQWEEQEQAIQKLANQYGLSANEMREQILDLGVSHERYGQHLEMLQGIGDKFGLSMGEVAEALNRQQVPIGNLTKMSPELAAATAEAAVAIDQLKQAYDEAYESALSSIESQLGLFGKLRMDTDQTSESMRQSWRQQVEDMALQSDNLDKAIAYGLSPNLVQAFSDIEHAAELNKLINEIEEAGAAVSDGTASMTEDANALVTGLNTDFEAVHFGKEELAHTMAEVQTDLKNKEEEIIDNFKETIDGLDLSTDAKYNAILTMNGLINGIKEQEGPAANAMLKIGNKIKEALTNKLKEAKQEAESAMRDIGTSISRIGGGSGFTSASASIQASMMTMKKAITQTAAALNNAITDSIRLNEQLQQSLALPSIAYSANIHHAATDMSRQNHLLEKLIDTVEAGQHIVMDTGALVGATYPSYDSASGKAVNYARRWGR